MSSRRNTQREFRIQKPPTYWDNLSTVYLTQGALRELQRRIGRPQQAQDDQRPSQSVAAILQQLGNHSKALVRSSRHGGLDLSDLRGCRPHKAYSGHGSMKLIFKSEQPRESSGGSTVQSHSTPYSLNFEQHLVDNQVYPPRYWYGETEEENEPENIAGIRMRLTIRRLSLSPSSFSAVDFKKVKTAYCTTSKEPQVSASVVPLIEGNTSQCGGGGTVFNNLAPLTEDNPTQAKPDIYYGACPEDLDRQIRNDLNDMIIPCTDDSLPIAPNFFMEVKGNSGDPSVSKRQACHYGALGARGIQALQSYQPGKPHREPVYDNHVYTLTFTYQDGVLRLFAHHLKKPTGQEERPTCFMVPLRTFGIMDNPESFREGVTAYRNARDWTKEKRDEMIALANRRLREAQGRSSSETPRETPSILQKEEDEKERKRKKKEEKRKEKERRKRKEEKEKKKEKKREKRKKRKKERKEKGERGRESTSQ